MAGEDIRVGLIGAGGNIRNRHIPGFRKVKGVALVGVVNRSLESSHRVAEQFNIPRVYDTWRDLLADEMINAVCIGPGPTCTVR
jgi:predicted dehydrogenase